MLSEFLETYGLIAIFAVMLLKEMGVPVPIPTDLIMLGVATQAAQNRMPLGLAFLALLVPMLIGGSFQFAMARGPGRRVIYRLGRFIGLTEARLNAMMARVRQGGTAAVTLGLSTPGLRIPTTPASGLADLPAGRYFPGLLIGNLVFLGWHFALGYAGGAAIAQLHLSPSIIITIVVLVLAFGFLVAAINRRRRKAHHHEHPTLASFGDWANAACPVCATVNLLQKTN